MCSQRGAVPFGLLAGAPRAMLEPGIMAAPFVCWDPGPAGPLMSESTVVAAGRKQAT